jgi:hypothetical protein
VSGQRHATAALPSEKEPPLPTHLIGSWVYLRVGLGRLEKSLLFLPGIELSRPVAILTELFRRMSFWEQFWPQFYLYLLPTCPSHRRGPCLRRLDVYVYTSRSAVLSSVPSSRHQVRVFLCKLWAFCVLSLVLSVRTGGCCKLKQSSSERSLFSRFQHISKHTCMIWNQWGNTFRPVIVSVEIIWFLRWQRLY